ncbi:Perilipin-5 [Orchesella cincta]|uniref:Perilipin-5 n=1 Tax=Orchesella cincta TaxID=48709 RepID=A0A1D2MQ98_ORCCI|nr:Perilipin-5 [Orchesella cincta]
MRRTHVQVVHEDDFDVNASRITEFDEQASLHPSNLFIHFFILCSTVLSKPTGNTSCTDPITCMRRAELAKVRAMEVQQKTFFQAHLANSKFVQTLIELPMVKFAVEGAGRQYSKVKDSHTIVGKSFELAEYVSCAFVDKLSPIAEKGMSIASPISTKVDDLAAQSLEGLITRVPVISGEPQEIAQNTYCAIEKRVTEVTGYTIGYTETILKTWPAQSAMDVYESILNTACNTLDNFLPAQKDETGSGQNGLAPKQEYPDEEKHKRGMYLARRTYSVVTSVFQRVFGICQTQVENAATATDLVYKQVKNAVADAPAPNNEANATTNGESNKPVSKKQGKNKKNPQE